MQHESNDFSSLAAKAVELHRSGKLNEAAAAYREILASFPGHAAVLHNLGVIAAARSEPESALRYFEEALAVDGRYAPAHFHRAVALEALGKREAALSGYERVCRLDPGHYEAHRRLGFLWLQAGDTGRSLDHFARTYELRRGEDRTGIAARSLTHATRDKLTHDAAQFRLLARGRRGVQAFAERAQAYESVARELPEEPTELSGEQIRRLGGDYNTAIHIADAPELPGPAVRRHVDTNAQGPGFGPDGPGAIVLDDLLAPAALAALNRYLLRSTIWHDFTHIEGHVASYLEDGLACPLLLLIAKEIRLGFPDILADHPLSQAWAFKGLHAGAAIGAHADDGAVSVNLWLTPEAANAGPGGGMTVCLEPPPPGWQMGDYETDERRSTEFMDRHAGNSLRVAYRQNRAVMFSSRLLHRSDAPRFAAGYENHRINITLLFGTGARPVGHALE